MASRFDPLPYGLALLALGLGALALTFLSLGEDNVTYARTEWTALLAMALATPAGVLYPLGAARDSPAWRAFWTAGLLAYLMHLWWSVARTYEYDLDAIVRHQGWVAFANLAVTLLWTADVLLAWVPAAPRNASAILRLIAWLAVTASFFTASAVFKSGAVAAAGWLMGVAVAAAVARGAGRLLGGAAAQG